MTPPDDVSTRLAEIRERVEAATEGPWKRRDAADGFIVNGDDVVITYVKYPRRENGEADSAAREANADLLASARSDVPWLLDKLAEMANAAHDLLSDLEHADEWGHEAAQPSLDQSRERLKQKIAALLDAAQEGVE